MTGSRATACGLSTVGGDSRTRATRKPCPASEPSTPCLASEPSSPLPGPRGCWVRGLYTAPSCRTVAPGPGTAEAVTLPLTESPFLPWRPAGGPGVLCRRFLGRLGVFRRTRQHAGRALCPLGSRQTPGRACGAPGRLRNTVQSALPGVLSPGDTGPAWRQPLPRTTAASWDIGAGRGRHWHRPLAPGAPWRVQAPGTAPRLPQVCVGPWGVATLVSQALGRFPGYFRPPDTLQSRWPLALRRPTEPSWQGLSWHVRG